MEQCANIATEIYLGVLQIIGKLFQTIAYLGRIIWVSTVEGTSIRSLDIGLEFMLIILIFVALSALLLFFTFYAIIENRISIYCNS